MCLLEKHGDTHPILADVLMGAAMEAIDKIFSQVAIISNSYTCLSLHARLMFSFGPLTAN